MIAAVLSAVAVTSLAVSDVYSDSSFVVDMCCCCWACTYCVFQMMCTSMLLRCAVAVIADLYTDAA